MKNDLLKKFGIFVRDARVKMGLNQTELAERLGIGQTYISKIENGTRNVDLLLAMKICEILDADINEFVKDVMGKV